MGVKNLYHRSIKSNYILITSVSDEDSCMQHIKSKNLVFQIREKIQSISDSKIYEYLKKHKKIPIYLNIEDSAVKYDQKTIKDGKVAISYLKSKSKFQDNIFTFSANLTPYSHDNVSILKVHLERVSAKRNSANTQIITSISKNKIAGFNVFINNANLYIREKYNIKTNEACSYIIATKEGYLKVVTCGRHCAINSKSIKCQQDEILPRIKEEIDLIAQKAKIKGSYKNYGCDDGVGEIVIFSDIEEISKTNFSTQDIKCETDNLYFSDSFENEGIMAFLSRKSLQYKPPIHLFNKDLSLKDLIFSLFKYSRLLLSMSIILSIQAIYSCLVPMSLPEYQSLEKNKIEATNLLTKYPVSEKKNHLDTLIEAALLETINNDKINSQNWQDLILKTSKVIKKFDNIEISEYGFDCQKNCQMTGLGNNKLIVSIDVGNQNGYLHTMHYYLTSLRDGLKGEFGENYCVDGLDFIYQFNTDKKYFAANLTFSIYDSKSEKHNSRKNMIKDIFKHDFAEKSMSEQKSQPVQEKENDSKDVNTKGIDIAKYDN